MSDVKRIPIVAIDGPGGSGKGTIGRRVARQLGWKFLDSGALYRLVGICAIQRGIALDDAPQLAALAAKLDATFEVEADGMHVEHIVLEGREVTQDVRTEQAGDAASRVAVLAPVRQALLEWQHAFRAAPGLVADGRDMGTVVFPDADLKVFLTATAEERARRRYQQLKNTGLDVTLATILVDIRNRDARDASRLVAPLVPAADAVIVDSTGLNVEEVEAKIMALIRKQLQ